MEEGILEFSKYLLNNIGLQLINTVILAVVLTYLLYNPVKNYLKQRSEKISNDIEDAKKSKEDANDLKLDYENRIKNINKEREQILEETRKIALSKELEIIEKAKEEAENIKLKAYKEIELQKQNLAENVKMQIIEVSTLLTEKYISKEIDLQTQEQLFEETLKELEGAKWIA